MSKIINFDENLKQIEKQMSELGDPNLRDKESVHGGADELLLLLIKLLRTKCDIKQKRKIAQIVKKFNNLEKWYA